MKSRLAAQAKGNLKRAIADAAASEADDSEELSGIGQASNTFRGARSVIARHSASKKATAASKPKGPLKGAAKHAKAGPSVKALPRRPSMRPSARHLPGLRRLRHPPAARARS